MLDTLTEGVSNQLAPDYTLHIDGHNITQHVLPRLVSLTLTDNRGYTADTLELVIDDADGELQLPERGNVLQLRLGWKGYALSDKGTFTVAQISHNGSPDTVKIVANSADFRGSINEAHDKAWHDTTLGNIATEIAGKNQLGTGLNPELAAIPVAHVDQSKESDLSFLTRLAHRYGGEMTVKKNTLLLIKAGSGLTASGQRLPPVTLYRSEGDQHSFMIADRDAVTSVIANVKETSKPQEQTRKIEVKRKPQPEQDDSAQPFGYMSGKKENSTTLPRDFNNKQDAIYAAKAEWERLQREAATFSLVLAKGRETLCPDTSVTLVGYKKLIDEQAWTITKLTHTLGNQGFTTKLDLELAIGDVEYDIIEK